jgi:hypothetical protein
VKCKAQKCLFLWIVIMVGYYPMRTCVRVLKLVVIGLLELLEIDF